MRAWSMNAPISWESQWRENKQLTVFYLSQQIKSQLSWAAQGSFVSVYNCQCVPACSDSFLGAERGWNNNLSSRLLLQECTPFAVIGSNTVVEARGQRVRGRLYPWGIVEGMHTRIFHVCSALFSLNVNWNSLHVLTGLIKLMMRISLRSGKPIALWLCETEEHADSFPHARPQRRNLRRPLWKLQSAVHTGDDQVREEWKREHVQTCSKQLQ